MALKLKEARNLVGLTQAAVAKLLGTTQQTYQRWEQGKTEPSIDQLRELAKIFGTTTQTLIGKPGAANDSVRSGLDLINDPDLFWGHVGVRLQSVGETIYYPVTREGLDHLNMEMDVVMDDDELLQIVSLADKIVYVKPCAISRLRFVDNAAEFPEGESGNAGNLVGAKCGYPANVYEGLVFAVTALHLDPDAADWVAPELLEMVSQILVEEGVSVDEAYDRLLHTRVWLLNGSVCSFRASESSLLKAQPCIEGDAGAFVPFYDEGNESEIFFPLSQIAMIEMPRHLIQSATEAAVAEFEGMLRDEDESTCQ